MKDFQVILVLVALISSCNNVQENKKEDQAVVREETNPAPKIEARIFRNDTISGSKLAGFGYNILVDGKVCIHQPNIPAVSGSMGFLSEEDARQTAEFVAEKFRKNNALPSLSKQELDSLGIKLN